MDNDQSKSYAKCFVNVVMQLLSQLNHIFKDFCASETDLMVKAFLQLLVGGTDAGCNHEAATSDDAYGTSVMGRMGLSLTAQDDAIDVLDRMFDVMKG